MFCQKSKNNKGQLSLQVLIFGSIAIILLSGFLIWADSTVRYVARYSERAQALQIAEAGVEYYRWHLAHAAQDFQDGTGHAGPYIHDYYDKDGNLIGQFILYITPPSVGSTIVTIKSVGHVSSDSTIEKAVQVKMGIPSYAKYAAALNADVRFGAGTEVFGPIYSNGGIRFDGIAHNVVSSALSRYTDPDSPNDYAFAVHTHVSPADPSPTSSSSTPPNRPDVFLAGRALSVPALDFTKITQDLADIKTQASSTGYYKGPSGKYGYDLVLNTNNTFAIYTVNGLISPPRYCSNLLGQSGWGTWSISSESLVGTYNIPANGLIFIEDNVWVRGQINNSRVTIASAKFPDNLSTRTSITLNQSLLYSDYTGKDVIALIAQNNINIGLNSDDNLRVDAALMAQNGRIGRYYYSSACGTSYKRTTITSYGMIASSQRYGFAYTDGTGYQNRNLIYDPNLLYGPPPSFPLTSDTYQTISWDEAE